MTDFFKDANAQLKARSKRYAKSVVKKFHDKNAKYNHEEDFPYHSKPDDKLAEYAVMYAINHTFPDDHRVLPLDTYCKHRKRFREEGTVKGKKESEMQKKLHMDGIAIRLPREGEDLYKYQPVKMFIDVKRQDRAPEFKIYTKDADGNKGTDFTVPVETHVRRKGINYRSGILDTHSNFYGIVIRDKVYVISVETLREIVKLPECSTSNNTETGDEKHDGKRNVKVPAKILAARARNILPLPRWYFELLHDVYKAADYCDHDFVNTYKTWLPQAIEESLDY